MSVKTMAKKAGRYMITTVNGAKTTTGSFYAKELKEYIPLENGFNAMLADDVVKIISENQALWDQGTWRQIFTADQYDEYLSARSHYMSGSVKEVADNVRTMLAFEQDKDDPVCGTAMCFAGWVAELTGVDWVIDSEVVKAFHKGKIDKDMMDRHASEVLIKRGANLETKNISWIDWVGISEELSKVLVKRGFTPETHRIIEVSDYAADQLGGIECSPLFQEGNNIKDINRIVRHHVDGGPRWFVYNDDDYIDEEQDNDEE